MVITKREAKICKICNKKFKSSREVIVHAKASHELSSFENYVNLAYYNNNAPKCKCGCGKNLIFKANKIGPWYSDYCRNHAPKKPHTEETKAKIKKNTIKAIRDKFGVDNVFQLDSKKEKSKNTLLRKYGVDNIMKTDKMRAEMSERNYTLLYTDEMIQKRKNTNLIKYNGYSFISTDAGKKINRMHRIKNLYNNDWKIYKIALSTKKLEIITTQEEYNNDNDIIFKFKCSVCTNGFEHIDNLLPDCPHCPEYTWRSKMELACSVWLTSLGIDFITNKRFTIDGKTIEVDMYFPDYNFAIELNGLYWHSEHGGGKNKKYHLNKTELMKSKGIQLMHIFEDEWEYKRDIIQSKILHKLKKHTERIYARKCIVKQIKNKDTIQFINENHIQGYTPSTICYGLYHNNELVSCMTFSKPRVALGNKTSSNDNAYELLRFCSERSVSIIGGAGKMLKQFIVDYNPVNIITYADRRFTIRDSNLYTQTGFQFIKETSPNYFYIRGLKRWHRFNFTKAKTVKLGGNPNKTEWQNMIEMGYDRIWDCGHLKYEWRNE